MGGWEGEERLEGCVIWEGEDRLEGCVIWEDGRERRG